MSNENAQTDRDRMTRMEVTIKEVIVPALNDIRDNVKEINNRDYVTKAEAEKLYATIERLKAVEDRLKTYAKYGAIIFGALLATVLAIVQTKVTK